RVLLNIFFFFMAAHVHGDGQRKFSAVFPFNAQCKPLSLRILVLGTFAYALLDGLILQLAHASSSGSSNLTCPPCAGSPQTSTINCSGPLAPFFIGEDGRFRLAIPVFSPIGAVSASLGKTGKIGAAPVPLPGLPPEFTLITGPAMVTPLASSFTKLPPALKVSSLPASRTTLRPLERWISFPASTNWPLPILTCWLSPMVRWSLALTSVLRSPWVVRCSSAWNSL